MSSSQPSANTRSKKVKKNPNDPRLISSQPTKTTPPEERDTTETNLDRERTTSENDQEEETIRDDPNHGIDDEGRARDQILQSNPDNETVIPVEPLTRERIETLLYQYKKNNTKLTKSIHHCEFLQDCLKQRRVPKGLKLQLTLNAVDQDKGLEGRIAGILIQAELEILEELISHYEELNEKLTKSQEETQTILAEVEKDEPLIKDAYTSSDNEVENLKRKLKFRREDKMRLNPNVDERIKRLEEDVNTKRGPTRTMRQPVRESYPTRQTDYPQPLFRSPPRRTYRNISPDPPSRMMYNTRPLERTQNNFPEPSTRMRYNVQPPERAQNYPPFQPPRRDPNDYHPGNRPIPPHIPYDRNPIENQLGVIVRGLTSFLTQLQVLSQSYHPPGYPFERQRY